MVESICARVEQEDENQIEAVNFVINRMRKRHNDGPLLEQRIEDHMRDEFDLVEERLRHDYRTFPKYIFGKTYKDSEWATEYWTGEHFYGRAKVYLLHYGNELKKGTARDTPSQFQYLYN